MQSHCTLIPDCCTETPNGLNGEIRPGFNAKVAPMGGSLRHRVGARLGAGGGDPTSDRTGARRLSSHESVRRRRGTRGLRLWARLLSVIPEFQGAMLEKTSLRWPTALRRRFLSRLYQRYRKRWPYTPYRATDYAAQQASVTCRDCWRLRTG